MRDAPLAPLARQVFSLLFPPAVAEGKKFAAACKYGIQEITCLRRSIPVSEVTVLRFSPV